MQLWLPAQPRGLEVQWGLRASEGPQQRRRQGCRRPCRVPELNQKTVHMHKVMHSN